MIGVLSHLKGKIIGKLEKGGAPRMMEIFSSSGEEGRQTGWEVLQFVAWFQERIKPVFWLKKCKKPSWRYLMSQRKKFHHSTSTTFVQQKGGALHSVASAQTRYWVQRSSCWSLQSVSLPYTRDLSATFHSYCRCPQQLSDISTLKFQWYVLSKST